MEPFLFHDDPLYRLAPPLLTIPPDWQEEGIRRIQVISSVPVREETQEEDPDYVPSEQEWVAAEEDPEDIDGLERNQDRGVRSLPLLLLLPVSPSLS